MCPTNWDFCLIFSVLGGHIQVANDKYVTEDGRCTGDRAEPVGTGFRFGGFLGAVMPSSGLIPVFFNNSSVYLLRSLLPHFLKCSLPRPCVSSLHTTSLAPSPSHNHKKFTEKESGFVVFITQFDHPHKKHPRLPWSAGAVLSVTRVSVTRAPETHLGRKNEKCFSSTGTVAS